MNVATILLPMNDSISFPEDDPAAVGRLEQANATIKRSKTKRILLVDFQAADHVDDELVRVLSGLPRLREINLAGCNVTDAIIPTIRQIEYLRTLDLQNTEVTDLVIDALEESKLLKLLDVSGTRVTLDRVRQARKRMINTRIVFLEN